MIHSYNDSAFKPWHQMKSPSLLLHNSNSKSNENVGKNLTNGRLGLLSGYNKVDV